MALLRLSASLNNGGLMYKLLILLGLLFMASCSKDDQNVNVDNDNIENPDDQNKGDGDKDKDDGKDDDNSDDKDKDDDNSDDENKDYEGEYGDLTFANDYEEAMYMTVKFFGGQRCGDANNWMLEENDDISVDPVCHIKDEFNGNDLTGGWHDCGDHIKVAHTMGYSAVCLLTAYDVWPTAFKDYYSQNYGKADGIPDVLNEVKVATDYFMKSFPDENTFVYYVGNGSHDHDRWINSAEQSTLKNSDGGEAEGPREVMFTTDAGGSTAGNYSTALSLMSILYREHDAKYADKCLESAIKIYKFAKKNCEEVVSIPTFYPRVNKDWWDELALAATMLYRITDEDEYRLDSRGFYADKYQSNYPESWDTVADIAYYYMVKYRSDQSYTEDLLARNVGKGIKSATSYGLPWKWSGLSKWGVNKLFCGSAFAAALYAQALKEETIRGELPDLEGDDVTEEDSWAYNKKIVDYMLGDNEFGHPFIHGFKGDMTHKIHHRNSMGRTLKDDDGYTTTEQKNTLDYRFASGGLIGGPVKEGVFSNIVEGGTAYKETEGGCDYNAPFIGALANLLANQ